METDIREPLTVHLIESARASFRTIWWLTKIMIPASALVFILETTGILRFVSRYLTTVMASIGLPGEAAIALLTSVATNLYGVIAILPSLGLTVRQATILATVTLIAHGFFVEFAIARKIGTPVWRMFLVRGGGALFLGRVLTFLLPTGGKWDEQLFDTATGSLFRDRLGTQSVDPWRSALSSWVVETIGLIGTIAVLVTLLLFVTRWLRYVGLTTAIAPHLDPLMGVFGLPKGSGLPWIVANTLGLTYGAAVLKEESESGRITKEDGDLLNHHLGISHSLLEDTVLFAAVGIPWLWLIGPRLAFAIIVVWERRMESRLKHVS